MMSFEFAWYWLFLALPLPYLVYKLMPAAQEAIPQAIKMPLYASLQRKAGNSSVNQVKRHPWRVALAALIWILLVSAAARPQLIGKPTALPMQGRNLMLAVDISGSMQEQDMQLGGQLVSRLTAVKAVAGDFIKRRVGDRIGLILFGDQAYLQAPLSFDRNTVTTLLDEAVISLAGQKTAMGDAIALGVKRLRKQEEGNRVLIVLTDGANTSGHIAPLKAAELAKAEGVRIYTIGVGADQQVQDFFGRRMSVGSDLDEPTLRKIAKETGGAYFRARDLRGLQAIYQQLDKLEPISKDAVFYREIQEWYGLPLGLALLLIFIGGLLASNRLRPLLNSFSSKGTAQEKTMNIQTNRAENSQRAEVSHAK